MEGRLGPSLKSPQVRASLAAAHTVRVTGLSWRAPSTKAQSHIKPTQAVCVN